MSAVPVSAEKLHELERFLYKEASFLDRPDLDSWIDLYTEDGTYWMPAIPDQEDPHMHISLFYDDRVLMEVRRRNFVHPAAASKEYTVRMQEPTRTSWSGKRTTTEFSPSALTSSIATRR
jgi:3-phenylpropionate/cinnamic acid dioxygenase small subunit